MRHRLRTSRVCYSFGSRLRVMPQAFVVALLELVLQRARRVGSARPRDVASAWTLERCAVAARSARRRKELAAHRAVPDQDVRRLQVRGSARTVGVPAGPARLAARTGSAR